TTKNERYQMPNGKSDFIPRLLHPYRTTSTLIPPDWEVRRSKKPNLVKLTISPKACPCIIHHSREQMENHDRTFKELATLDVYPQLELAQSYELKSGLIHLLPKFHGLVGEDPHKHLKEFHVVFSTMRLQGIPKDYIKMKLLKIDCIYN
ncbi:hypothetical protein CR513_26678, partial [Mucuna pruriens]